MATDNEMAALGITGKHRDSDGKLIIGSMLGLLRSQPERAVEFCRRCRDASNLQDLGAMIEQRDLLARELAESQLVRTKSSG